MAGSRLYVDSPAITPYPFGLLSVAQDRGSGDGHWMQGVEYDSDNCATVLATASGYCIAPPGTNEVQTVTITGGPTGGTFTLSYNAQVTNAIVYNASAAQVQTALEGLNIFEPGDIAVTGNAPAWTVTFTGNFASTNVSVLAGNGSFTGGVTPGITVNTTTQGVSTPKTVSALPSTIQSDPFTVYLMRACGSVGAQDAKDRAVKAFAASEQQGVERGLWTYLTTSASGAVDLTGGTTRNSLAEGLAVLEKYAGQHYGGPATVHADRGVVSMLGKYDSIEQHGNKITTPVGNLVSAGGGYGDNGVNNAAPAAGEAWLFITGVVSLWSSAAFVTEPFLQTDATGAYVNQLVVMAERTYLASPDCMVAAVRAKTV
jgi:hypothetical protein